MIETMNNQQAEFANRMRKYDLLQETDFRFSSPKLDFLCVIMVRLFLCRIRTRGR